MQANLKIVAALIAGLSVGAGGVYLSQRLPNPDAAAQTQT